MEYPDKIQCHGKPDEIFTYTKNGIQWSQNADGAHARSCSYCGSLHPEDLVWWLENKGMWLDGADWKYGWPHKFYLELGPKYPIKFYNTHLRDLPSETFQYVADLIEIHARVKFTMEDGKLGAYAPRGYQAGMERYMGDEYKQQLDAWWEKTYQDNSHLRKPNANTDESSVE